MSEAPMRRGGRDARRAERTAFTVRALPTLIRKVPVYEMLDEEGVERLHQASMAVLEDIGIDFRDPEALSLWRAAGAKVAGQRVHLERGLVLDLVGKTPERYTLHARNPERTVEVGGEATIFAPTYGSPFVLDLDDQRRYGTLADLEDFCKLAYLSPAMHMTGGIVCEPVDVPVPRRHLAILKALITHSDKPFMGAVTSAERAEDSLSLARIVFGDDFVARNTVMTSVVNCNSPLVWDATMLDALKVYARAGQAVLVSPFVLGGASTPASAAASVAQLNAEALAGIAFAQLVRPGAPMVYGQFLAPVSMRSGAPMAGTPEICWMNYMVGQLARRYRLPWRSSGMTTGAKVVDAQAAYESIMTLHSVMLAGANVVLHAAGWLEGGLTASFAKFVLDCEQMEMVYRFAQGPDFTDLDEALAAIAEVGPGGHFLGAAHTREHFQSAFFMPELMDNSPFEQWEAEGARDANARAKAKVREMLAAYQPPSLAPGVAEALEDFVRRRTKALPEGVT